MVNRTVPESFLGWPRFLFGGAEAAMEKAVGRLEVLHGKWCSWSVLCTNVPSPRGCNGEAPQWKKLNNHKLFVAKQNGGEDYGGADAVATPHTTRPLLFTSSCVYQGFVAHDTVQTEKSPACNQEINQPNPIS